MGFFSAPTSYRLNAVAAGHDYSSTGGGSFSSFGFLSTRNNHESHPPLLNLILLVFEAVMEVVCVSLPGYIVARQGMFDADNQKFVANLNVALFTPCLIFTKLASQLTAETLVELAIIPIIFLVQTAISYMVSIMVSKAFGFGKRPANFVTAMGVFGNSNSLPISLVISLAQTLKGLHWDQIPGDNDDEVSARGILYLLIFQQLGQMLRWSWGYHVLLAPAEKYENASDVSDLEEGQYRDDPADDLIPGLDGQDGHHDDGHLRPSSSSVSFESGGRTPIYNAQYAGSIPEEEDNQRKVPELMATPTNGNHFPADRSNGNLTTFPAIRTPTQLEEENIPSGIKGIIPWISLRSRQAFVWAKFLVLWPIKKLFYLLPKIVRTKTTKFFNGLYDFMNPPLWAMLIAIIVASVPALQRLFFTPDTFIANSVTRAIAQSGGVAVPLILVVLGANLARNTLPQTATDPNSEENQIGTKLLIASIVSRMLLPTLIMAPLLALTAKFVPISILDDPIFIIVCFLLTGAPSALQLAQICQINGVYEGVMSKLLFQSYVIWILPSTLILVMCALEVVEWAAAS